MTLLQNGARAARSHGLPFLAHHHYIRASRLRRPLPLLPVTLYRRPTGATTAAAAAASPYNCYIARRAISTGTASTTTSATTGTIPGGSTKDAVAPAAILSAEDAHVALHTPSAAGDVVAQEETSPGETHDGAEPGAPTQAAASSEPLGSSQSTPPAQTGLSTRAMKRQARLEILQANKDIKAKKRQALKEAKKERQKARKEAKKEKQKLHLELMAKQDEATTETLQAAAKRIAEQKQAKAAKEEKKRKEKQKQQPDEHRAEPSSPMVSPLVRKPGRDAQAKTLANAFAMAKRYLRNETRMLPARLLKYKALVKEPPSPKSEALITAHLARTQTALGYLRAAMQSSKQEISVPKPTTPSSKADELISALAEIELRSKQIQKVAASRPRRPDVPATFRLVITTICVLKSVLSPPKKEELLKGVAARVEDAMITNYQGLSMVISKIYPELMIVVGKSSPETSQPTDSATGAGDSPQSQNTIVHTLPPIFVDGIELPAMTESSWKTESESKFGPSLLEALHNLPKSSSTDKEPKGTTNRRPKKREESRSEGPAFGSGEGVEIVDSRLLSLTPVETPRPPVPKLTYGLDRVLFNPGVYQLRDLRTGVYNFDPYLANLMPITEFDYGSLSRYITSSKDTTLIDLATTQGKKYTGSTSSMTSVLAHFHFLLSSWRPLNPGNTTRTFHPESVSFTRILRSPAAVFLHYNNGTYAVDADKEYDKATVLSMLGQSMEKLFTTSKEEFERYRKSRSHELTDEEKRERNAYNYTEMGDFLMRSQLDAKDDRLPGTGIFDLKTRAVISIRMDAADIRKALGYEITRRFGDWESYEREYYDLVRSAFLKYSLQVRMGRMDGIFVAYHNTQNVFGFQYFPLSEMDFAIHGTNNTDLGDREFKLSIHLLNKMLDRATERFPGRSLRLHFETRTSDVKPFMYIFAKPVTPEEIDEIQTANEESVAEFERNILGVFREDTENASAVAKELEVARAGSGSAVAEGEEDSAGAQGEETTVEQEGVEDRPISMSWPELRYRINEALEKDELAVDTIRDAVEDALEDSGLMPTDCGPADSKLYVDTLMGVLGHSLPEAAEPAEVSATSDAAESHIESTGVASDSEVVAEKEGVEETSSAEAEELGSVSNEIKDTTAAADYASSSPVEVGAVDEVSPPKTQESEPILNDESSPTSAPEDTSSSPAEPQDSDSGADVGKMAVEADILAASVPHAQQKVAALKELFLLHDQQRDLGADKAQSLAQIREFERVLSSALSDHIGTDDHLHRLPHPSVPITPAEERADEIVGFNLVIRNRVGGTVVSRPNDLNPDTDWDVEYSVTEMPDATAQRLYRMVLERRKKDLEHEDKDADWYRMFQGQLHKYSTEGRVKRDKRFRREFGKDVHVYGEEKPRKWHEAFESSHVEEQIRIMGSLSGDHDEVVEEVEGNEEGVEGVKEEAHVADEYLIDEDLLVEETEQETGMVDDEDDREDDQEEEEDEEEDDDDDDDEEEDEEDEEEEEEDEEDEDEDEEEEGEKEDEDIEKKE